MRASQRGMSYWTVLFGIGLFGLGIKVASTIGPVYLDYYTLDKMIQAKFREPQVDSLELKQFKLDFSAQMTRNNMRDRKLEDLMIISRDGNKTILELNYEERRNLMSNLDMVAHFKKSYSSEKPDGFTE